MSSPYRTNEWKCTYDRERRLKERYVALERITQFIYEHTVVFIMCYFLVSLVIILIFIALSYDTSSIVFWTPLVFLVACLSIDILFQVLAWAQRKTSIEYYKLTGVDLRFTSRLP